MDPNLFHLDWGRTAEALTAIIVLSFVVERGLAIIFESKYFIEHFDVSPVKELMALGVSIGLCIYWQFDAVSMFVLSEHTSYWGAMLTGAVIAGGSKASIKLFHDVMGIKSNAYEARHEIQAQKAAKDAEGAATTAKLNPSVVNVRKAAKKTEQFLATAKSADAASQSKVTLAAVGRVQDAKSQIQALVQQATTTQ